MDKPMAITIPNHKEGVKCKYQCNAGRCPELAPQGISERYNEIELIK